ncbi:glycosyltransferase family 2 protein [Nonomuraea thailandensis]
MLHAQRVWDGTLATNRLDDLGVNSERQRMETKDVTVGVGLLVDGRPEDVRRCLQSVLDHTNARVLALDLGDVDGAGDVLRELADRHPERIAAWHVAEQPHWRGGTATWGESRAKLLRLDESEVHVLMDTDVVLRGDALTPLVAAVASGAVAAGWRGLEPSDGATARTSIGIVPQWRQGPGGAGPEWREAGPGKVRALTGGSWPCAGLRRSARCPRTPVTARTPIWSSRWPCPATWSSPTSRRPWSGWSGTTCRPTTWSGSPGATTTGCCAC